MGNVTSGVGPAVSRPPVRRPRLAVALAACDSGSESPTTPAPTPAPAPAPAPAPPPSKDDPAAFTQAFVQRAVDLFEAEGLEATLAAYNDRASVDESWYVFVMDAEGVIIAHATVAREPRRQRPRAARGGLRRPRLRPRAGGGDRRGRLGGLQLLQPRHRRRGDQAHLGGPPRRDRVRVGLVRGRAHRLQHRSPDAGGGPTGRGLGPRARTGGGARLLRHARLHERPVVRGLPRRRDGSW